MGERVVESVEGVDGDGVGGEGRCDVAYREEGQKSHFNSYTPRWTQLWKIEKKNVTRGMKV